MVCDVAAAMAALGEAEFEEAAAAAIVPAEAMAAGEAKKAAAGERA